MNRTLRLRKALNSLILAVFGMENAFSAGIIPLDIKPVTSEIINLEILQKERIEYDDLQRKTKETVNYGSFSLSYAYEYYKNGAKKSFTNADGVKVNYTYDEGNRLQGINIPGAGFISYNSFQWNSPTKITLPGGSNKNITYDPLMRVKQIIGKDQASNEIMNYAYTRDKVGNVLSKQSAISNQLTAYTYNKNYELTKTIYPDTKVEEFIYDKAGNRETQTLVPRTQSL